MLQSYRAPNVHLRPSHTVQLKKCTACSILDNLHIIDCNLLYDIIGNVLEIIMWNLRVGSIASLTVTSCKLKHSYVIQPVGF